MSDDPLSVVGEKRLKLERERIDRQYNDALTALDHALQRLQGMIAIGLLTAVADGECLFYGGVLIVL